MCKLNISIKILINVVNEQEMGLSCCKRKHEDNNLVHPGQLQQLELHQQPDIFCPVVFDPTSREFRTICFPKALSVNNFDAATVDKLVWETLSIIATLVDK